MADAPHLGVVMQGLAATAAAARHRWPVVLAGGREWCRSQAGEIIGSLPGAWCCLSDLSMAGTTHLDVAKAHTLLGGEWHGVVYDAFAGLDPDALGAVAGTVQAGGLLLLLTPPLAHWPDYPDPQRRRITVHPYEEADVGGRFLTRMAAFVRESSETLLIEEGAPLPSLPAPQFPVDQRLTTDEEGCATAEQRDAVEALCRVAQGHRRRPLVLVADRGRGKSAALGLAAARLLQQGLRHIVVTAPRLAAVEALFEHAAGRLGGLERSRGLLRLANGSELRFEPPDRVVHEEIACDLLLVDEAAALPVGVLEPMLRRHARIAFATTVHGYEGSGRGFDLRFRKTLDVQTPQWRRLRIEQPIRWAPGDPLERMVTRALLLDAEPAGDEVAAAVAPQTCRHERLDRDALLADEQLLSQIFGLLVLAHYRTSPADLRHLLDGPNLDIHLLRHQETVMGCALVAREGGFDATLAEKVARGERRLRGNLMPQSLAQHAGLRQAPGLVAARVMRIAIHPARQGVGLGRALIEAVRRDAEQHGADYLGASFGGEPRLLDFWYRCGALPVHVGMRREPSSGAHALMVMLPLSKAGEGLHAAARRRLARQLPALLSEPLAQLEAALVVRLLRGSNVAPPDMSVWQECEAFARGQRDYGNALAGLCECLPYALSQGEPGLTPEEMQLVVAKVLQRRPWGELVAQLGLAGQREAEERLRQVMQRLCTHFIH